MFFRLDHVADDRTDDNETKKISDEWNGEMHATTNVWEGIFCFFAREKLLERKAKES